MSISDMQKRIIELNQIRPKLEGTIEDQTCLLMQVSDKVNGLTLVNNDIIKKKSWVSRERIKFVCLDHKGIEEWETRVPEEAEDTGTAAFVQEFYHRKQCIPLHWFTELSPHGKITRKITLGKLL